jgi:3-oxoacyl-(acyl-carrier-protein) synthase
MHLALKDAGRSHQDVDYINAHGTSTPFNDKIETLAIKRLFGEYAKKVAISSTKSMMGHLLGAAGAVESIVCILAIQNNIIPPTINYEIPDPECDLNYTPNQAIENEVNIAVTNSFGFGGHNVCLVLERFENK